MTQTKTKFEMKALRPSDRAKKYYARVLSPGMIMVAREKHSTRYFKAGTLRDFCAAALLLLDERWGPYGYWGTADESIESYEKYIARHTPPELTVEELVEKTGASPDSGIVTDLKRKWKDHQRRVQQETGELDVYRRIKKAIEERDGLAAAQVLNDRRDHEYESWDFEKTESPLETD